MTYAATNHIGHHKQRPTKEATAVAPTIERVHGLDAKTQRRSRNKKGQEEVRTGNHVANGFLSTRFLPKLEGTGAVQARKKKEKTERDIYTSLSQLAGHYGIEPMQTQTYTYPYNMALALWDAEEQLKKKVRDWDEIKLVKDRKITFITTEERCRTGTTLYYIPVIPLFKMLHDPVRKKAAQLLVSVCSYLYHIADIPYYRLEDSYIYWQYEMMKEWVEQDEEAEETEVYNRALQEAEWVGGRIEQKLFNPTNLTVWERRLKAFIPKDEFEQECRQLACDAFALYTEYPQANIFRNAAKQDEAPDSEDGDYDPETIGMEKYISFVADTKGWLYESLEESINMDFNEYGSTDEPTIIKSFDGEPIPCDSLDFESRLFALIDDTCYILNNYKTTKS